MTCDLRLMIYDCCIVALCYFGANLKQWRMVNNEKSDLDHFGREVEVMEDNTNSGCK